MCPAWRSAIAVAASASARRQHRIAGALEYPAGQLAHLLLVLDQQHRLGPAARLGLGGHAHGPLPSCRGKYSVKVVPRGLAVHVDEAAALLHDAVHRGERRGPRRRSDLRRLENALERLAVHRGPLARTVYDVRARPAPLARCGAASSSLAPAGW